MASRIRRSAFATPFVLVLGCGKPAPRTLTAEQVAAMAQEPVPPEYAEWPIDAPVDTGPDAMSQGEIEDHCSGRVKPVWNCNPPPPPDARIANANPPGPLVMRVINVNVRGDGIEATFGKGSNAGLAVGMKGYLVRNGKKVAGSDFVLTSVTERASRAVLKMTMDQVQASPEGAIDFSAQ